MVDLAAPPSRPLQESTGGPGIPGREVRRRHPLPGGRAVVGGFLVAAAAVGVFASYTAGQGSPATSFVVARRDVAAGERLQPGDLELVPLDLPAEQVGRGFTDIGVLDGAVVLGPLLDGELVQASDVAKPAGGDDTAQISFSVRSSAVPRDVKAGERVDVIVVYGSGESATVSTVAAGVVVVGVDAGDDRLAGGDVVVTVAVPGDHLEDVAHAASAGTVTVARTTALDR